MNKFSAEIVGAAKIRVLLLEDSHIDAELVSAQIAKVGAAADIVRATIRREFLEALESGPFDLIIADYSLPDFDGLSALSFAQEKAPAVPFVFVSGVMGEQFATEAMRAGATDYVVKRELSRVPVVIRRALDEARERRERQRAVSALEENESRFRDMADSAPALIWSTDGDRLSFANLRFQADYGARNVDMIREGWARIVVPEDRERFDEAFGKAFEAREPFRAEVRTRNRTDEIRWLRCEAIPRHDGSGSFLGYSGCAVDVTDSKIAREMLEAEVAARTKELREKEEALRQSQKMEAIGQLTGGIAHDFNNMLAGILGSAELMRRRLQAGRHVDCEKYIDAVISSANRAAALTQRMLAFSRRQSLDIKSADISTLIVSLEEMLRRTLGESIRLELELEAHAWPAMPDVNQLESAILNLAINARDAMPDGGSLRIRSQNRSVGPEQAGRIGLSAGDYVVMSVADTDSGMSREVQEKAFDPFFTTKPIGQGTGLGLSMIFGFARQLGGLARIISTEGEGTTIEIYIPRDPNPELAAQHEQVTAAPEGPTAATVLVVEDEAIVQVLVVDTLNEMGYQTLEAHDAPSALAIVESDQPLDLMVTDVGLPGMDGRQLAEVTRQHRPRLNILFATGYAEAARSRSGFLGEGMDLISKPFDMAEFEKKVKSMIGRG